MKKKKKSKTAKEMLDAYIEKSPMAAAPAYYRAAEWLVCKCLFSTTRRLQERGIRCAYANACAAFRRWRDGVRDPQPEISRQTVGVVQLRDRQGPLACYRILPWGKVRFIGLGEGKQ